METRYCASDVYEATPDDDREQRGSGFIYTGGDCAVLTDLDVERTLPADFAGMIHPVKIKKVLSTGTTASAVLVYR